MRLGPLVFEWAAAPYDLLTRNEAWRAHCGRMADALPGGAEGSPVVLDLGCGPGVSALAIGRARPELRLVGLDLSSRMIRRAKAADRDARCDWIRGDALRLPFADGVADAVTGNSFLYLLPDRPRGLEEIRRVLRPGGRLVLTEPTRQSVREAAGSVREALGAGGPRFGLTMGLWRVAARANGAFAGDDLRELLASAGFHPVSLTPTLHGLGWRVVAEKPVPDA